MTSALTMDDKNPVYDIAVSGSGVAGLAAALAAAEKGAAVLVLEKNQSLGGRSVGAEGFFAADSPDQQKLGIDAPADVLFKMAMEYSHWRINPRLMRAYINKSGDTVRWLEAKGLKIDRVSPFYRNQVYRVWHQPKGGGREIIDLLIAECEKLGVKFLRQAPAKMIVIDPSGKVAGLTAIYNSQEIVVKSKCVIIATGGYGGNQELLKKYCPTYSEDIKCAAPWFSGDGLLMAMEAGAANAGLGAIMQFGPRFDGVNTHVAAVAQEPDTVWVNIRGERFADETLAENHYESINILLQQPHKISFTLLDETIKQRIIDNGPFKIRQGVYYGIYREDMQKLNQELQEQSNAGKVKIGNSWETIAEWIGVPASKLISTVEEYNAGCECGYDRLFTKERRYLSPLRQPPYYALRCRPTIVGTLGGIKINHLMQVINHQNNPIPGLYAAGTDAGGWETDTYNVHLSGSAFGFPLNSGRIAGENALEYAQNSH
jgi:fumarate reductase flavoprotein subunit